MVNKKEEYYGIFKGKSRSTSLILLYIGIIGGILIRAVLILNRINPAWASIAWYVSMILFIYFYSCRVYVESKRQKLILTNKLREKLRKGMLSKEDMKKVSIIIDSVAISKVKWNHLILLIMTIAFLILQAILDIMKVI